MQEIIDTEKIAVNESSVFHQPFPPPYYVTYFSKGSTSMNALDISKTIGL